MNSLARISTNADEVGLPRDRAGLVRHLGRLCDEIGADYYMLVDLIPENGGESTSIVASNWVYDTVRAAGPDLIGRLVHAPRTTFFGQPARLWRPSSEVSPRSFINLSEAAMLEADGHVEIASTRIKAGGNSHAVLFSSSRPRSIAPLALPAAHLSLSYALSALSAGAPTMTESVVSDRERECLRWVSEGKTAEEIATIVGVAANTVNSYVNHAMHKLSARNRAMAIATAIRAGEI